MDTDGEKRMAGFDETSVDIEKYRRKVKGEVSEPSLEVVKGAEVDG